MNRDPVETDEDFTGYEKDSETGFLYAGARYYMAALGRFGVTDRFADKYPSLTPYQYAANAPTINIDVNGDSIDVSNLSAEHQSVLAGRLAEVTGMSLSVADGMLIESPSSSVSIGGEQHDTQLASNVGANGGDGGSKTAASALSFAMSDSDYTTKVKGDSDTYFKADQFGGTIWMDFETLLANESAFSDHSLASGALGIGLSFMHELDHSPLGAKFAMLRQTGSTSGNIHAYSSDHDSNPRAISLVNLYRRELGPAYGQRPGHQQYQEGRRMHIPWIGPNGSTSVYSHCSNRNDCK